MESRIAYQQAWIVVNAADRCQHQPLYLAVVEFLQRAGVADVTVLRDTAERALPAAVHATTPHEQTNDHSIVISFITPPERGASIVTQLVPQFTALVEAGALTAAPTVVLTIGRWANDLFPPQLTVAEVMRRGAVAVASDIAMREIITLLIDQALRSVAVVDAGEHIVGIVTDGDLRVRGGMDVPINLRQALPLQERAAELATLADWPLRAHEIMTPHPITVQETTPLAQAAALLVAHDLKRLPVVDAQGRLAGMISCGDLLGIIAERLRQRPDEPFHLPSGASVTVGELMLRHVPTVHHATPLDAAMDTLLKTPQRRVLVVDDDRRVVGVLTDGDVIRRADRLGSPSAARALLGWIGRRTQDTRVAGMLHGRTVADVMTSPVVTVMADTPLADAIRIVVAQRITWMPVVDGQGRLVGLIGRAGLLGALCGHSGERSNAAE